MKAHGKRKRGKRGQQERDKRKRGKLWTALREAQHECGCNTKTLKTVLKTVSPFLKSSAKETTDAEMLRRFKMSCKHPYFLKKNIWGRNFCSVYLH